MVVLDTYHDHRSAFFFTTNAVGNPPGRTHPERGSGAQPRVGRRLAGGIAADRGRLGHRDGHPLRDAPLPERHPRVRGQLRPPGGAQPRAELLGRDRQRLGIQRDVADLRLRGAPRARKRRPRRPHQAEALRGCRGHRRGRGAGGDHRPRTRRQGGAGVQPEPRRDGEHRLRAGGGRRTAGEPDPLRALLPRAARVLPRKRRALPGGRSQPAVRTAGDLPVLQPPDRALRRRRDHSHRRRGAHHRQAGADRCRRLPHPPAGVRRGVARHRVLGGAPPARRAGAEFGGGDGARPDRGRRRLAPAGRRRLLLGADRGADDWRIRGPEFDAGSRGARLGVRAERAGGERPLEPLLELHRHRRGIPVGDGVRAADRGEEAPGGRDVEPADRPLRDPADLHGPQPDSHHRARRLDPDREHRLRGRSSSSTTAAISSSQSRGTPKA